MNASLNVGIVGASGAVGNTLMQVLEKRNFPINELSLFSSARSAGQNISFNNQEYPLQEISLKSLVKNDLVFFCASSSTSKEYIPKLMEHGVKVIDKSSAYRMDPNVPLVVPEINAQSIQAHHHLIANPNCSAIMLLMGLAPLRNLGTFEHVIVSTYQSASGGGKALMEELIEQTRNKINNQPIIPKVAPHPYAFNLFSHNTPIGLDGLNEEEQKIIEESQKILELPNLQLSPTCIRVPVLRCHTESVTVLFKYQAPSEAAVLEAYKNFPGIEIVNDAESNTFPMPSLAEGRDEILVGRIRSNQNMLQFMVCGDQLLKGAALNAVQIAEKLFM